MSDWRDGLETIPEHMRDGLVRYIENGIYPGSFLAAVLCNDLKGAYGRADMVNSAAMPEWAAFMYNYMPADAQGSEEKVRKWIAHRGLSGINDQQPQEQYNAADEF